MYNPPTRPKIYGDMMWTYGEISYQSDVKEKTKAADGQATENRPPQKSSAVVETFQNF